jgi:hypothetical protein
MAYSYHDGKELVLDLALARLVPLDNRHGEVQSGGRAT